MAVSPEPRADRFHKKSDGIRSEGSRSQPQPPRPLADGSALDTCGPSWESCDGPGMLPLQCRCLSGCSAVGLSNPSNLILFSQPAHAGGSRTALRPHKHGTLGLPPFILLILTQGSFREEWEGGRDHTHPDLQPRYMPLTGNKILDLWVCSNH